MLFIEPKKMLYKITFFEVQNLQLIPFCGYYCSLLPLNPSMGHFRSFWCDGDVFPTQQDNELQTNNNAEPICHYDYSLGIAAKHHLFEGKNQRFSPTLQNAEFFAFLEGKNQRFSPTLQNAECNVFLEEKNKRLSKTITMCDCVNKLLEHCKMALKNMKWFHGAEEGDVLIYEPEQSDMLTNIRRFIDYIPEYSDAPNVRDYNLHKWWFHNGEWTLANAIFYKHANSMTPGRRSDYDCYYTDRIAYFICFPMGKVIDWTDRYVKYFTRSDCSQNIHQLLSRLQVVHIENRTYLAVEEHGIRLLSQPVSSPTSRKTSIGMIDANPRDWHTNDLSITEEFIQKEYGLIPTDPTHKSILRDENQFISKNEPLDDECLRAIETFLKNDNVNCLFLEYPLCFHIIKSLSAVDESKLINLNDNHDDVYCYVEPITWLRPTVKKLLDGNQINVCYDHWKDAIHICVQMKRTLQESLLQFAHHLRDKDHVWEHVKFNNQSFMQSTSYLYPKYQ